jgi:hypothetical protein
MSGARSYSRVIYVTRSKHAPSPRMPANPQSQYAEDEQRNGAARVLSSRGSHRPHFPVGRWAPITA